MSTNWTRRLFPLLALAALVALAAACAPAAAPTPVPTTAPANTQAPAATAVPATKAPATAAATAAPATAAATTAPAVTFKGDKLAAPDCKYTDKDGNAAEMLSVEATDASTVVFKLCSPDPAFDKKIAFIAFAIMSKDDLAANGGDTAKLSVKPNGTGPYMLKEWVRGDHITFEANPNYWGDKAKAKTAILRWSKEAAQRLLELQSGTVDGIDNVGVDDIAAVKKDSKLALFPRDPLTIAYLGFNNKKPPFDNEKVRQALAMAIDRKRIIDNFYAPGSLVAEQFAPPAVKPGHNDLKWYTFDAAAAKKAIADAGFPNGFDMTLSYRDVVRPYLPSPAKVAQDIQAQLKDVGINVKLDVQESSAFISNVRGGEKIQAFLLGWTADFPDATNWYDTHFSPAIKQFGAPYTDLTKEITAGATIGDNAERQKHYDLVNQLIKQHVPMIPIGHGTSAVAFKASVKGAHSSPLSDETFSVMDTGSDKIVFMQNAEPGVLWCGDEEDGETFRACVQMYEPLLNYKIGATDVVPALAEKYEANADATQWTFHLRKGVKFFDGHALDANDVVATIAQQWDAKNPTHKGRQGLWTYFGSLFGAFLNSSK